MKRILGVGWDVGGWRGGKQAVAVVRQDGSQREWLGSPRAFTVEALEQSGGSVLDLIRLGWSEASDDTLDQHRVIIAIDAPLGYPSAFQQLVTRRLSSSIMLGPEISNPFAYRETERWVHRTFGKKPLSAAFDKLGNNATVAMYHVTRWAADAGFRILPFQSDHGGSVIIEVYPALVKDRITGACSPHIARCLPGHLPPRSDEQDAAISALHALCYALQGDDDDLPALEVPPATIDKDMLTSEGWIYHVPVDWLSKPYGEGMFPILKPAGR